MLYEFLLYSDWFYLYRPVSITEILKCFNKNYLFNYVKKYVALLLQPYVEMGSHS